ncbi:hypothetical protein ES705_19833 [subsurface metagenome]
MKSTEMIHEIITNHGSDDNRELMEALKALKIQVVRELTSATDNARAYLILKYKS